MHDNFAAYFMFNGPEIRGFNALLLVTTTVHFGHKADNRAAHSTS